jgi:hypothetical protein
MSKAHGRSFWVLAAAGWGLIGWGVRNAALHQVDTRPGQLARFFFWGVVAHDLILSPLVLAVGVALARLLPGRARGVVQVALLVSGCATLFAWPEVRDYARVLHNPTSLPRNYTANLLIVLAAAWAVTGVVALAQSRRGSS